MCKETSEKQIIIGMTLMEKKRQQVSSQNPPNRKKRVKMNKENIIQRGSHYKNIVATFFEFQKIPAESLECLCIIKS